MIHNKCWKIGSLFPKSTEDFSIELRLELYELIRNFVNNENIAVMHIDENSEQLTQDQVIERLTGGQLSMLIV